MAVQYAFSKIVTDGLVLALDAADRNSYVSGSTIWRDLSGIDNNGTLTNGPTFSSTNGGSVVFDGVNDYISFPNNQIFNFGTNNISFRFIIQTTSNTVDRWNTLYCKRSGASADDIRTYIRPQSSGLGILRLYIANSTSMDITTNIINTPGIFDINFVLIRSQYWAVYINGNLANINNSSTFTDKQSSNISGSGIPEFGRQLSGEYCRLNLYSFNIYNRALSASEVLQNYNAQKARFGL